MTPKAQLDEEDGSRHRTYKQSDQTNFKDVKGERQDTTVVMHRPPTAYDGDIRVGFRGGSTSRRGRDGKTDW